MQYREKIFFDLFDFTSFFAWTFLNYNNKFFIPVGCFLLFNIGDFVGRMLASVIQWPKANHMGSIIILGLAVARVAFIPLFLFCNVAPNNRSVTDVSAHTVGQKI